MSRVMVCLPVLAILEATGLPAPALAQGVTTPPVTGIVARVTAQGTATVSWTAVTGATGYHVIRWNPGTPGCCKNMSAPNLTGTSWQDGTLPQNGTYTYRVYAITPSGTFAGEANLVYNAGVASTTDPSLNKSVTAAGGSGGGTSLSSGPTSTLSRPTSGAQLNTGPAPANLQITGGVTTADLQWDPVTGATGYRVARALAGTTSWIQLTPNAITATKYSGDALPDPRSTYTYQVTATQADGHYGVTTGNYTPPLPADPTEFSAVQTAEHEVELSWRDAPGVGKYLITGPGAPTGTAPSNGQLSGVSISGGQIGGVYGKSTFRVTGIPNGAQSWTIASSYEPGGILTTADKWPKASLTVGALSGHYRVSMLGFDVNTQTLGDPFTDGRGDEVYLAAYVSVTNTAAGTVTSGTVRSKVYGDVNGFAGRITAGTLSPQGGLKTTDAFPLAGGGSFPATTKVNPDVLPMLLWEGTLTNDVDRLIIAPSIWESDNNDTPFTDWTKGVNSWLSHMVSVADWTSTAITPVAQQANGYVTISVPGVDHPIGVADLSPNPAYATYTQRYLPLTRQKIETALTPTGIGGLAPGVIALKLNDVATSDGFGGVYTIYLRVERLP